nr:MAG TPA: Protein of unknown function (DUF736) [Caudoviricetes sp.]
MNIGYFKRKSYKNAEGADVGYVGGVVAIPFLRPLEVVMLSPSAEDKKKNKDFPDFQLALQKAKGYEGQRQIVGALWRRQSKDGTKNYISGFIETPAVPGYKVYIALFNAGENAKEDVLYDIVWNTPKRERGQDVPPASGDLDASYYADEETIPF